MPHGGAEPNPWGYLAADFAGNKIQIQIPWNTGTRALLNGGTVTRDTACRYHNIYIGTGANGTVEATPHKFTAPAGTTAVPVTALNSQGLNTVDDLNALQITAGP